MRDGAGAALREPGGGAGARCVSAEPLRAAPEPARPLLPVRLE